MHRSTVVDERVNSTEGHMHLLTIYTWIWKTLRFCLFICQSQPKGRIVVQLEALDIVYMKTPSQTLHVWHIYIP